MITFKQYLAEGALDSAINVAKTILGKAEKIDDFDDSVLDDAKEEEHKFVNAPLGKWLITVFKTSIGRIAQITAPRDTQQSPVYFIQRA